MKSSSINSLIKNSISLVKNYDFKTPLPSQCKKYDIIKSLKQIQTKQYLSPPLNKNAIGIRNLFEHPLLRITIYYLGQGNIMQLHDHKQMNVISAILNGKLEAKHYKSVDSARMIYEKSLNLYHSQDIFYIDGQKTSNLHEFKAIEQTFFLDIIFPDYSQSNECNFYKQSKLISKSEVILQKTEFKKIIFQDI